MFRRGKDKRLSRIGTGVSHSAVTAHKIHVILWKPTSEYR